MSKKYSFMIKMVKSGKATHFKQLNVIMAVIRKVTEVEKFNLAFLYYPKQ